jgi:hypothetical protein
MNWRKIALQGQRATASLLIVLCLFSSVGIAQEMFRRLREKEIQARVVGNDIVDSSQWSMYLRPDGTLIRDELTRKVRGFWKIENNKLCLSSSNNNLLNCHEVWMSGQNVRLRVDKYEETFDAVIAKHKAD